VDMTTTTVPKSDQINAEDVMMSGPITVTVESVDEGGAEQPVNVHLVEYPRRAYRPSKSMRRVMVKAWGKESDGYTGHRMTLYYDPDVKFGGVKVGGIKISAVSHITKRLEMALTETKGKRALHTVEPLTEAAAARPATRTQPSTEPDAWEPDPDATPEPLSDRTRKQMFAELTKHGITDAATQRAGMSKILGREIKSRADLTEDDGRTVILDLMGRPVPRDDRPDEAEVADADARGHFEAGPS